MRKWTIRISICLLIGGSTGFFWYREFVESPQKPAVVSKQGKPIRIYTKVVDGRWSE